MATADVAFKLRAERKLKVLRKRGQTRIVDWLFNRRIVAAARRREHVLCLGDSHVNVLNHVHLPGVWFRVRMVGGATASGLLNSGSVTKARTRMLERLANARPWQKVLLQLGEVDCGYVIWHRASRYGLAIEEQLTITLDCYASFLEELVAMGFSEIIVLSAPLPTIDDLPLEWQGSVASERKDVTATQEERTDLTLRFNGELKKRCGTLGVTFVDATSGHLDRGTNLIDTRFLKETKLDHHLAPEPYSSLIADELGRAWRVSTATRT